jgi:diketogulonate reductase-like aldo/keto reductase
MVGFGTVGLEDGGIKPSMTEALSSGIAMADTAEASKEYPQ